MTKLLGIFFLVSNSIFLCGQTEVYSNNAVYGELLGNAGSFVSINYERLIRYKKLKQIHTSLRVGFSLSSNRWDKSTLFNVPFEVNTLFGKNGHFVEFGLGRTLFLGTNKLIDSIIPIEHRSNFSDTYFVRLGYRYMNERIVLRVAPLLGYIKDNLYSSKRTCILGLGISVGGCFNFYESKNKDDAFMD